MARWRRLLLLWTALAPGPAAAQLCGDLDRGGGIASPDAALLRADLAAIAPLSAAAGLRCDTRDETEGEAPVPDRTDSRYGCTIADVAVILRNALLLDPAAGPRCALVAAGDCCAPHESVGCEELAVTTCVCDVDPRCCTRAWDATCASLACSGACAGVCVEADVPQPNLGLTEGPGVGGCPVGMALVADSFCIDRFEASLTLGTEPWSPYFDPGSEPVAARSIEGAVPQGYMSQAQATVACANAGKRLCTDTEWLRACRGPSSTTYPYGSTRIVGACNDERTTTPHFEYFGTDDPYVFSLDDHACLNQLEPGLATTGSHPLCTAGEGVYDMVGGLGEWTADPGGTYRGGFYTYAPASGPGCLFTVTAHNTLHRDHRTGFRCCL